MLISKNISISFAAVSLLLIFADFGVPCLPYQTKKNVETFDCPTFDYTSMVVTNADCGEANGSITGIKIISTGTKTTYAWHDVENTIIGHSANLINIPAGVYRLEVSDNGCTTTVFSSRITVSNNNAITFDDQDISIKSATCGNTGAITGILVTNATSYKWIDVSSGTAISTSTSSPDLVNAPPGNYQLLMSNSTCQVTSKTYNVPSSFMVPKVVDAVITPGLCGELPASVVVTLQVLPTQPRLTYEYVNDDGAILSSGPIIAEVPNPMPKLGVTVGGTYRLLVVNDDGCAVTLGTYELPTIEMSISPTESVVGNDRCNQHIGYIVPVILNGGRGSQDWIYTWTDVETNKIIGVNKTLSNVSAGTYKFYVKKPTPEPCTATATFTITNISPALVPPIAEGTTSCLPSLINITVTNVDTSKLFRLYDSPTSTVPIDSSKTGIFYKQVDQTTDYYVTRVSKDCESDRTKVTETVVVSIKIPNAFTPNGDGVNDTWVINGIDKFPGADLKIFTRYGKLIYHSINYPIPFDGTHNGAPLPAGAYYYILDVKQPICYGKISGSITIIR